MQDGATAYTANYCSTVLNEESEGRLVSHRSWSVRSPDLHPNICETTVSVKVSELKLSQTIFLMDLKFFSEQKGDILSIYCDGELS
jgi:hypothetical protein